MANTLTNALKEIVGGTVFLTQWAVKQKLDKFPESPQKSHLLGWAPFLQSLLCLKMNYISLPAIQEKSLSGLISFVEIDCWEKHFFKDLLNNLKSTVLLVLADFFLSFFWAYRKLLIIFYFLQGAWLLYTFMSICVYIHIYYGHKYNWCFLTLMMTNSKKNDYQLLRKLIIRWFFLLFSYP